MFSMFRQRSTSFDDVGTTPPVDYALLPEPIRNAPFLPLRLTMQERKIQRLMRGIMLATSYTDKVDREELLKTNKRDAVICREVTNALCGFVIALGLKKGAELLREKDFGPFSDDICAAIELCRRYKIMNPDRLRTDYVKFLYMVQDAVQNEKVRESLGFSVVTPVVTVGATMKALGAESVLSDERLPLAITPVPVMSNRTQLNKALRFKDVTVNRILEQHSTKGKHRDDVEQCIRSLNDVNDFSNDNVESTVQLLELLKKNFSPESKPGDKYTLAITEGQSGSRLTHDHARQFTFVLQSLSLWKNICRQMFALWTIAEADLLNPDLPYEFRSTGQGFQRVQKAPTLYAAVQRILKDTQRELGQWVGSEQIHLGDNQVPNAFHFIDKYGQISRIIVPLLRTITHIDELAKSPKTAAYLDEVWGSAADAKKAVLSDFFRHAFDGSGGDNMDDAGSCIDGRLTSAWNWCNSIRSKPFYPLFLLAGFTSFDGDLSL
jgi:hypothetical protein